MKTIALTLFAAALGFAQSSAPATSTTPAPKDSPKTASTAQSKKPGSASSQASQQKASDQKAKAQAPAQSVPAGAKLVEPNLYRFTDSNGKTWNYRQTPFGISKWEEKSAPTPEPAPSSPEVKSEPVAVTDLGDSYRFDKKTPFGQSSWVRKKSELTDDEKALPGVAQPSSDPGPTSANSKPAGNQ